MTCLDYHNADSYKIKDIKSSVTSYIKKPEASISAFQFINEDSSEALSDYFCVLQHKHNNENNISKLKNKIFQLKKYSSEKEISPANAI